MDVKFLKRGVVAPASLAQKISEVGARGVLLSDLATLEDLDGTLTLKREFLTSEALMLMGGRAGIVEQLALVGGRHPAAAIHYEDMRQGLVVDIQRETGLFKKNKTIVQIRGITALGPGGHVPDGSVRVGYFLGTNIAYEITLTDLSRLLAKEWE